MFEKRKMMILELLNWESVITVKALSRQLDVSEMTIRRDLIKMEKEGFVRRAFGEVTLSKGNILEQVIEVRAKNMTVAKKNIAQLAANLVKGGDSVFIDQGTTTAELSKNLSKKAIVIATASIKVASIAKNGDAKVYLSGGELARDEFYNLLGPTAEMFFRGMHVDFAFVSCGGIDIKAGVTEYSQGNAHLKQIMMDQATTKVLLVDASKFDQEKLFKTCGLEAFNIVITDEQPPREYRNFFKQNNVELLTSQPE